MVSRKPKLIAAGAVLAAGFGVACLFRRDGDANLSQVAAATAPAAPSASSPASLSSPLLDGQFSPQPPVPANAAASSAFDGASSATSVAVAIPALPSVPGAAFASASPPIESADLGRASVELPDSPETPPIYVIQRGDTLESIADRSLGDARRAWELFDLNRDVLDNPHILPLGAELRIPASPTASAIDGR